MKRWCAILLLQSCVVLGGRAWGQTCSVAATPLAFGNTYQPLIGTPVTTTSTVTVTCVPFIIAIGINYTISLGPGGGTIAARRMTTTGGTLRYQIYRDMAMTQIWGDGTGGSFAVGGSFTLSLLFPVTATFTAYGIIPANSTGSVGMYNDSVMITITY
jgi:spore coat protein U-like protein